MSEFFVGQRVVCVDDEPHGRYALGPVLGVGDKSALNGLKKGEVYTIADITIETYGAITLVLHEISRPIVGPNDYRGFAPQRFRPIEYRAMSIFRSIAANPKIEIREDA